MHTNLFEQPVHIGTIFPQWKAYLFRFGLSIVSILNKSFVLSAYSVEKRMQHIRTD